MAKFDEILTETGDKLIAKRAGTISEAVKEQFEEEIRDRKKEIRRLENEIVNMEDLSVRNTQTLIVGEDLDTIKWTKRRIDIELELKDVRYELETIEALVKEYFA